MLAILIAILVLLPDFSSAQGTTQTVQAAVPSFVNFVNFSVVPLLLIVGFLIFVVNVIRYFVADSANEESRDKAKNLALYAVLGFVIIIIFWGVVNFLVNSTGLDANQTVGSDYQERRGGNRPATPANINPPVN